MPAYNFKVQFANNVEAGKKLHTIRPKRKRPTKPGERLILYTGMRTKNCRLLVDTVCKDVQPVEIHATYIRVGGRILNMQERVELAMNDGFDSLAAFYDFFRETYGLTKQKSLTNLELITWYPPQRVVGKSTPPAPAGD